MASLQFNKPIVSSVNAPIPTRDLLSRLQALLDELSAIDQDAIDKSNLMAVKDDLANRKLLKHSNVGVQAYVCCCIADILRICAPDAPFTGGELSTIFKTMFQQFKKLNDQENPYFQQQAYLLKILSEFRSIILITDLPDSEAMILQIFDTLYELASSKNFPTKLEPLASNILSEIILETDNISNTVLKKILNKLITNDVGSSSDSLGLVGGRSNISNPAFNFSVAICEANVDRMSRQIAKLFSEMLYEAKDKDVIDRDDRIKSSLLIENLKKIHRITIQIWRFIPEMLISLIGLIDDELKAEDEKIRVLATETIGKIIGSKSGGSIVHKVDFVVTHRDIWLNWIKKTLDVSPVVRCKWVEQVPQIVEAYALENSSANPSSSSSLGGSDSLNEIVKGLLKCLLDTDERVRFTAVKSIDKISFNSFMGKVCDDKILSTLFQLLREKNPDIRNQVMKVLSSVYNEYLIQVANGTLGKTNGHDSIILEIPNQILSLIYINDLSITSMVDTAIFEQLLPFETNDVKRVDRLCETYSKLDSKSKSSFIAINRRQRQIAGVLEKFLDLGSSLAKLHQEQGDDEEKENQASLVTKLDKTIEWLCQTLPDGFNSRQCLERFYKLSNFRLFYLLKVAISYDSDYVSVKNSMKELLTRLNNPKNLKLETDKTNISTTDMISNFKLLMYRSSMLIFNKSNVAELLNYSKGKDHKWREVANEILENISNIVPEVFNNQVKELVDLLNNDGEGNESILRIIYHYIYKIPDAFPKGIDGSNFHESLKGFAINGSPVEAKYSIKILSLSNSKEIHYTNIFNSIYPLKLEGNEKFATHLSTIAELFLKDPLVVEEKATDITSFLIKEVLLTNRQGAANGDDDDFNDAWNTPILNEKILSLRIFMNRLRSSTANEDITTICQPVLKLFVSLIGNGGEIVSDNSTPNQFQCYLRLYAGFYILKLAKIPFFNEILTQETINRLIYLLQDSNAEVRGKILYKLEKYLSDESVSERFLPLIFFMAHEPNSDLKLRAEVTVKSMYKRHSNANNIKFESSILRLIHMISHTSEFKQLIEGDSQDEHIKAYSYALEYLVFFLRAIAKPENVSLLYYFASRVKQYRDASISEEIYERGPLSQTANNVYCVSELAQLIIKEFCELRNWAMQTWPGKVKLANDLFAPMKSTQEAHAIITKVYISDEVVLKLKLLLKYKLIGRKRKRERSQISSAGTHKRRLQIGTNVKIAKKVIKKTKAPTITEPSRKSNRSKKDVVYAESDSEEDDDDLVGDDVDISNFSLEP